MADAELSELKNARDIKLKGVFIPKATNEENLEKEESPGKKDDSAMLNTDGDFVALHKIKQKKAEEKAKGMHLTDRSVKYMSKLAKQQTEGSTEPAEDSLTQIREELFKAVTENDIEKCRQLCKDINKYKKTLTDAELRDPLTNATVLHIALEKNKDEAIAFFLKYSSPEFLMEQYDVSVNGIYSKKNALHILTENGNANLTKTFLDKLPDDQRKKKFLTESVVVQIEGQRPRHLPPIHIAALLGNWDMVKLFLDLGMSVNHTNNKLDTPILWASRWCHIDVVKKLIKEGADVNAQNDKGSSPLYWAVRYGYPELTELLLQANANVHQQRKLGLVTPIVLASALGYDEIVKILIKYEADPCIQITGGTTPLHHAATGGHYDVVQTLLESDIDINANDVNGDTPLIYAVKEDHQDVVILLLENGADLERKNKENKSAWNFAIDSDSDALLFALVDSYKRLRRINKPRFTFPVSRTPLHLAAAVGNAQKIKCLLELGVDPGCTDEIGNTFFHIAARYNYTHILNEFNEQIDFNSTNVDGDTCLHLACRYGHSDAISRLIKTTKLGTKNKAGETALHVAVRYSEHESQHISDLVTTMIKAHNWSLVNDIDNKGNTALHLAARSGNIEAIQQLSDLNLKAKNDQGDTPLHVAAQCLTSGVLQNIIEVFKLHSKPIDLNIVNNAGDTLLHICCRQGLASRVDTLIREGADLAKKGGGGNSPLHVLVEAFIRDTETSDSYIQVFEVITDMATMWWCAHRDLDLPEQDSSSFRQIKRKAILYLISHNVNADKLSVIDLACKLGARDFLEQVFILPDVFMFQDSDNVMFDVTHIMPETSKSPESSHKVNRSRKVSSYDDAPRRKESLAEERKDSRNCLQYITNLEPVFLADQILALPPFFQIATNYWQTYQWLYVALMLIHIIYMFLLSFYSTEALNRDFKQAEASNGTLTSNQNDRIFPFIMFLSWPILLLLVEMYLMVAKLGDACRGKDSNTSDRRHAACSCDGPLAFLRIIFRFIGIYLNDLSRIIFSCFVIAWYVLYVTHGVHQEYILAVSLIFGWMCAIVYTTGFQAVHSFTSMLGAIIVRDIGRFLLIYLFVLLAFSFAFHALFQVVSSIRESYSNPFETILFSFNLMVGMGETDFFSDFEANGRSKAPLEIIYVFYIILATIVLLNLLIAMMNDSYTLIREREGTTWRVGSVTLALRMERFFSFLPRLLGACGLRRHQLEFDEEHQRWLMTVPVTQLGRGFVVAKTESEKLLEKLENKVNEMSDIQQSLASKLSLVESKLEDIELSMNQGDQLTPRLKKKFSNLPPAELTVTSRRARPKTARLRMAVLKAAPRTSKGNDNQAFQV